MTPVYEEHPPDAAIAARVHCRWRSEEIEAGAVRAVPPDGRCELIAHVGVPYEERQLAFGVGAACALLAAALGAMLLPVRAATPSDAGDAEVAKQAS